MSRKKKIPPVALHTEVFSPSHASRCLINVPNAGKIRDLASESSAPTDTPPRGQKGTRGQISLDLRFK